MFGTFSKGIFGRRLLPSALEGEIVHLPRVGGLSQIEGIIGWGLKDNTRKALDYADKNALPYLRLEDGFIRSVGLGVSGAEPFGFILDRAGIYYDATRPSDIENLIKDCRCNGSDRAAKLIGRLVSIQVSKYNHVWNSVALVKDERPNILLIDQTYGDLSVNYGLADETSFRQMIETALNRYPQGRFFVKTHPDVIAGKKRGYLTDQLPESVKIVSEDCNPIALLQQVDHIFTVTSQMGFEALMAGKPVSCFGMPFYAGWGLTEDLAQCSRRGVARSLEQVFEAAYLKYVRYVDPVTGRRCQLERILDIIESHKKRVCENKGDIYCFGFRFWKRGNIRRFLGSSDARVHFAKNVRQAKRLGISPSDRIVVWGMNENEDTNELAQRYNITIERIEDGFIRSVGLGSDFARPSSLILDRRGIYFDPRRPSDLEHLLNTADLDETSIARAQRLRKGIIEGGISKYNNGGGTLKLAHHRPGQTVILVPGQVEDDASIRTGSVEVRSNLGLLNAVRQDQPDAYIMYKPHPDVLAGNRIGAVSEVETERFCDQIVTDCNISLCLDQADQVHTITSLTGFEALLRGKEVHTYGLPFYAGWGLTHDQHRVDRRWRKRSVDELVYCCLILYPRYYHWGARCFVEVEDVIYDLQRKKDPNSNAIAAPLLKRLQRKAAYMMEGLRS